MTSRQIVSAGTYRFNNNGLGGREAGGSPLASTEYYDPVTNTFGAGSTLPGTTYDQAAAFVRTP